MRCCARGFQPLTHLENICRAQYLNKFTSHRFKEGAFWFRIIDPERWALSGQFSGEGNERAAQNSRCERGGVQSLETDMPGRAVRMHLSKPTVYTDTASLMLLSVFHVDAHVQDICGINKHAVDVQWKTKHISG